MKLKYLYLVWAIFICLAYSPNQLLRAQEYPLSDRYSEEGDDGVQVGSDLFVKSGRILPDGRIDRHPILQPGLWFSYGDLTGSVWIDKKLDKKFLSQVDVNAILDYSHSLDNWVYSFGLRHFSFSGKRHDYQRCSMSLSCPWLEDSQREHYTDAYIGLGWKGFLNPSLNLYSTVYRRRTSHAFHDEYVKKVENCHGFCGFYGTFSLSHDFGHLCSITDCVPIFMLVEANISFRDHKCNKFLYSVDKAAFTDANLTLKFPIQWNENWVLTPYIAGTTLIDHDIRDHFSTKDKQGLLYGVSLSATW